ncbi:MAG: ParB/Srx family N-terminal domain-containing protein, partial [Oscillospiraceae bacterium]|nr:ParB/Srx family N-terminal domain-containing protein [Oscillospiraceae bacterium]
MKEKNAEYYLADINNLIPYARNARTHSEEQVAQIAASIREFGFLSPIIISEDYTILCGHGRFYAAQKLGLKKVPCIKESHLTETQKRAYILADNKLSLNAGWDDEMLAVDLTEFQDEAF